MNLQRMRPALATTTIALILSLTAAVPTHAALLNANPPQTFPDISSDIVGTLNYTYNSSAASARWTSRTRRRFGPPGRPYRTSLIFTTTAVRRGRKASRFSSIPAATLSQGVAIPTRCMARSR